MTGDLSPLRDRMIFLVGARRSGTNWLQRVVGAHPDVALVPSETYLFSRGIKPLRERFHHGVLGSPGTSFVYLDPKEMMRSFRELCDRVFLPFLEATPGATRLAERTPEHVTCLDLIGEVYPDASFVHIVRDGRDVVRSLVGQAWGTAPGSIEEAAEEWRGSVEAGESAGHDLNRYRTVLYEDLLADPGRTVADLYGWLGLSATPEVVKGALIEAEVRFNEDPGAPAIGAGKWREAFTEADLKAFMGVAGETLERLGYETGAAAAPPRAPETPPKGILGRRRAGKREDTGDLQRQMVSQLTGAQRLLDRVVAALLGRRMDLLRDMTVPSIWIRVVGPGDEWRGRGDVAWERFGATLRADEALDGRQIAGDLHAGLPTSTAVLTFAAGDGSRRVRTIAVSFQNGAVARLVYYKFALAPDGGS